MTWRWWLVLGGILGLAGALRCARMGFGSLTFDEQWHLELSTGRGSPHVRLSDDQLIPNAPAVTSLTDAPPWWKVWTNMDFVVHPPLYCLLLRIWRETFGGGDVPAHLFSIVCSLVAIGLLFDAARLLHGPTVAAWACLILAIAPTQVLLGQQVRGYMLLEAFAMGACATVIRLDKLGMSGRRVTALGACILGMMLTHYFAIGACAALLLYACIRLRGKPLRAAIPACAIAALVYAIIWGPFLWKQRQYFSQTADPWLIEQTSKHLVFTLLRTARVPWTLLSPKFGNTILPWALLLVIVGALLWKRRSRLLLWCLWLLGTLGLIILLDLTRSTRQLEFARYVSLAVPAVVVLIAGATEWLPTIARHALPAAVVLACAAMSSSAYTSEEPDWRDLGRAVDALSNPDDAIVFYPGLQPGWYREIFYLGATHYSRTFPRPMVKLSRPADSELIAQLPGKFVLLVSGQLDQPPEMILPGCKTTEQTVLQNLAICTRMSLPQK